MAISGVNPGRLVWHAVVGRIAAARDPADQGGNGEDDARQGDAAWERQAAALPRQFGRKIGESRLKPKIVQ